MTDVRVHLDRSGETVPVGVAHFTRERHSVTTTFTYEREYIADRRNRSIDPAFPLYSGNQYTPTMPGAFSDSAPDRWGRNLLMRRERQLAREEGRTPRSLDSVDYLLGVNDETRQGALRFTLDGSDEFLSARTLVPPLVELPALLRASDEVALDGDSTEAFKVLLAAGTASLGGARPKASVRFDDGTLGIAKFPHQHDAWDVMAWEASALDIAERAGIRVPGRRLVRVGERHVLLLRRFDRADGGRIGYMSAMTMLGATDGDTGDYADIAERLADESASLSEDRAELFDRAVLNVALHDTDDHLRNHGLLAVAGGWRLSPAFDINPNPELDEPRSTSLLGAVSAADEIDGLLELATVAGLGREETRARIIRVAEAAHQWRDVAARNEVPAREHERLGPTIDDRIAALERAATGIGSETTVRVRRGKSSPRSNAGSFGPRTS